MVLGYLVFKEDPFAVKGDPNMGPRRYLPQFAVKGDPNMGPRRYLPQFAIASI
jgi:hypothetical protein